MIPTLAATLATVGIALAAVGASSPDGDDPGNGAGQWGTAEHEMGAGDDHETGGDHDMGGEHGHHGGPHHMVPGTGEADPAQISAIRAAMAHYEDVETARAEGWRQELPDDPELGAHFAPPEGWDDERPGAALDLTRPDYLIYSRIGQPDWQLVAVAYVVDQAEFPDPPADLRGASYHEHVWTCVVDGEEVDEDDAGPVSRDDCRAMDGEWSPGAVWMTHVWLVDNPDGIFAETNPARV